MYTLHKLGCEICLNISNIQSAIPYTMIILQPEILLHVVQLKICSTGFGEMFT